MTDTPTKEDFEAWRAHPVTEFVLAGMQRYADLQQSVWKQQAWGKVVRSDAERADFFADMREAQIRADTYEGFAVLTYEQALGTNGVESPDVGQG